MNQINKLFPKKVRFLESEPFPNRNQLPPLIHSSDEITGRGQLARKCTQAKAVLCYQIVMIGPSPSSFLSTVAGLAFTAFWFGAPAELRGETDFAGRVLPLLEKYCYECHDDLTTKGNLDLTPFLDAESVVKERKLWLRILHQIESKEMPPEKPFPAPEELATLVEELDHSVVLFGSCMKDGNLHVPKDLPLVLLGKGGGKLTPGRHIRCKPGTPLGSLHLTLLDKFGVEADSFGSSKGLISELG
jgi:hypothetical protein